MTTIRSPHDNYKIYLSWEEYRSLAWAADRYESADLIYKGLRPGNTEHTYWIKASAIIAAHAAIPGDGSEGDVIPCIGGELGQKITALFRAAGV